MRTATQRSGEKEKARGTISALDLASSYVLGKGFIWVHAWPTFWFVWFVGIHCVFAYVLQQLVKSVASLLRLFSTYGKVFALVLTVSLIDYTVGSYTTYGKIIWSEKLAFSIFDST